MSEENKLGEPEDQPADVPVEKSELREQELDQVAGGNGLFVPPRGPSAPGG